MAHLVCSNEVMYFIFVLCFYKAVIKVMLDVLLNERCFQTLSCFMSQLSMYFPVILTDCCFSEDRA